MLFFFSIVLSRDLASDFVPLLSEWVTYGGRGGLVPLNTPAPCVSLRASWMIWERN